MLELFEAQHSSFVGLDFTYQSKLVRIDIDHRKEVKTLILSSENNPMLETLSISHTCLDMSLIDSYKKSNGGWIDRIDTTNVGIDCPDS